MENAPAQPKAFWWAAAGALLMLIGAFGPWARVLSFISVSGTDAGDGWFAVAGAALAAFALFRYWQQGPTRWLLAGLAGGILGGAVAVYDLNRLSGVTDDSSFGGESLVSAGWGIYLDIVASGIVALASGSLLRTPARFSGREPPLQ